MPYVYRGTPEREKIVRERMEEYRVLFGDAYPDFLDWTGGDVIPAEWVLEDSDRIIEERWGNRGDEL